MRTEWLIVSVKSHQIDFAFSDDADLRVL